jgi:hypothetical protein
MCVSQCRASSNAFGFCSHAAFTDGAEDANKQKLDPFCGSSSATSFFALYLPLLASNPNTPTQRCDDPNPAASASESTPPHAHHNKHTTAQHTTAHTPKTPSHTPI